MKKLILLILPFFLCGCYNYIEIDELAVVSLIAIDYQDNEYNITIEIRENKKDNEEESLIYNSKGPSFETALRNASFSLNKSLFFADLDVCILTKNAINNKIATIFDYLIRENNISLNFNALIAEKPEEIIEIIKSKKKVAGNYISDTLKGKFSDVIDIKFADMLNDYLSEYKDIIIPYIEVNDDNIKIDKAFILRNDKIADLLDINSIQIYNLLNNKSTLYVFHIKKDDKYVDYYVMSNKSKITFKDNYYIFDISLTGSFNEIDTFNLDNNQILNNLKQEVNKKVNEDLNNFINTLSKSNSDILGLKKISYNKTRKKINTIEDIKYKSNINILLNRKGLIFNSIGGTNEKNN